MNKKLLLSYEEGYGDNGFDLVEFVNDKGRKFVFSLSYDFGGSLCFVDLFWGSELGNEKFIEECKNKLWNMEDNIDDV